VAGGHGPPSSSEGSSPLHHLAPEVKLVAAFGVVVVVLSVPRGQLLPYLAPVLAVLGLVVVAHLDPAAFVRRLSVVAPVLAFVVFLPFLGGPPEVEVLGVGLSEPGLQSAASILAKGLLGASVAVVLSSTTDPFSLLVGLRILRVPAVLVAIAMFMVRFLVVVEEQARTMAVARRSRAHQPRWLAHAAPAASAVGSLFVRSFERGERVHGAMVSRGWSGVVPEEERTPASSGQWVAAATFVLAVLAGVLALRLVSP
jgi:cobalt/nickel transport system permease protein